MFKLPKKLTGRKLKLLNLDHIYVIKLRTKNANKSYIILIANHKFLSNNYMNIIELKTHVILESIVLSQKEKRKFLESIVYNLSQSQKLTVSPPSKLITKGTKNFMYIYIYAKCKTKIKQKCDLIYV